MRLWWKDEHPVRLAFLAAILSLTYLAVLLPVGFLEAARLRSHDAYCRWRSAIFPPPHESADLLLVTVDEESQRRLGKKWPWDRSLFGEFLTRLSKAGPSVVGLDFVLNGDSDPREDMALAQAIRSGPPVLLASYLDRHGDPVLPHPLFSECGGITGLINHPRDIDLTVRQLFAGIRLPMRPQPLFGTEINAAAIYRKIPLDQIELELNRLRVKLGPQSIPLEPPVGCMAINYRITPAQISTVSFWQVMKDLVPAEQIRGKIVLVGSTREITHDVYPTSLGLMPGILISANGILTILSGEFIRPLPVPLTLALGFLFVLAILMMTYWMPIPWSGLATAGITLGGVGIGFLCLLKLNARTESLSVFILAGVSWLSGILYKYLLLIAGSMRLHQRVVTDPISGAVTERYFRLRMETDWAQGKHSRKPASLVVLQMESVAHQLQQAAWPEVQKRVRTLVEILHRHVKTRGGLVGRLRDDCLAIFLPGVDLQKTRAWTEEIRKALPGNLGHLAFGIACTQQSPMPTADRLLLAADSAARRSWSQKKQPVGLYDPARDNPHGETGQQEDENQAAESLDYIASEFEDRNTAVEKALEDLRQAHKELEGHFLEVTKSLVMAMDTKDAYTAGHLERVSRYATRLAETLQFPKEEIEAIQEAALLHDIGKLSLPEEILHKTGALTPEEVEVIKKHLELGAKILDPMKFFRPITAILYHHHERYDGKGYPHGLTGEFIPSGAQIITIADSFDAMTTNRGYNKPKNVQEAIEELHRGAGTQFNPDYVEAFIKLIQAEGPHLAGHTSH